MSSGALSVQVKRRSARQNAEHLEVWSDYIRLKKKIANANFNGNSFFLIHAGFISFQMIDMSHKYRQDRCRPSSVFV